MIELRLFDNGLLGYKESSVTKQFTGSDNEPRYLKNLQIKPTDWYYRTNSISYIYNSTGHRCHEIDQIDFDNYILFAGDSHAEGVGLELNKTFAYLTSQRLGLSYYNLGLGSTGIDYLLFNLVSWISKYPKPKFVFSYWSDPTRFLKITVDKETLSPIRVDQYTGDNDARILVYGEMTGYFSTKHWLAASLLKTVFDNYMIPFYNFYIGSPNRHYNSEIIEQILPTFEFDHARDDHHGIKTHNAISDVLCEKFQSVSTD